jgi:cytochrome c peroxidase
MEFFSDPNQPPMTPDKIALGKRLFHDKRLSSQGNPMSCATCHLEDQGFAQSLKTPPGLTRNSPTVAYAALQKSFFWEGRSGSLEGQIVSVVESPLEFHSDLKSLETALSKDSNLVNVFADLYPDTLSEANVRNALADYVRSLIPFNSKFDRNIRGEEQSLTLGEIQGFNLFMGKAKCATCHFPAVFNGTIPPRMAETELEHLGTPENPDTSQAKISRDLGRFQFLGTQSRKHFFKTPTVRNVALTAPYMHNGVYTDLHQVVDFYNRGGGVGIGIEGSESDLQTLPSDPLNLTAEEQNDLVAFLKTLTDAD